MKTEEEKKETAEKFLSELKEVVKKYGAKHFSVCCELEDNYFGIIGMDIEGYGDLFESAMNVGRLYQSCREKIKTVMDKFESWNQ